MILGVDFDRTIESSLPGRELWRLMQQAFEEPNKSPIWPVDLEESDPVELREGAKVAATYKIGPLKTHPSYRITDFEPGHSFSYESEPSHPLEGGATVVIQRRDGASSALRWHGSYRPRLHPLAPGALLFVRLYFLRTFFARLEQNLRDYEASFAGQS